MAKNKKKDIKGLLMTKSKQLKVLKSKIWCQKIDEVIANPYDYENQKIFIKEAKSLLNKAYKLYEVYQLKFHIDNRSLNKCIWMLQVDALDTLRDCFYLIEKKKHRLVGKMFRDVVEVLDIARLIKEKPNGHLNKWYGNNIIQHKDYRKYLQGKCGINAKENSKNFYQHLSRWTHHVYFTLKNSYSLGAENMMVYDSHSKLLVLPQTVSQYLWMLSALIKKFIDEMTISGLFTDKDLKGVETKFPTG
jgi:hypothetical protein